MSILTKCSRVPAVLFFISSSLLVHGEIVEFNGKSSPENLTNEAPAAQDRLGHEEESHDFIEQMKLKLKKIPEVSGAGESKDVSGVSLQKGEGLLTKCNYRVGEKACGKCFCLKANLPSQIVFNGRKLKGCARLDISLVGDLDALAGQAVYYEGTSDFNSSFICPRHFKLFTVRPLEEKADDFQPGFKAK